MCMFALLLFVLTGSMLYEFLHSGNLPGCVLLLYCASCLLFLGGGSTGRWVGVLFSGVLKFPLVVSLSGATAVISVWGWVVLAFIDVCRLCPVLCFL